MRIQELTFLIWNGIYPPLSHRLSCYLNNETTISPGLFESKSSMGAGQSTSHSHLPARALHVLRVTPSSPAFQANIEAFFDFVVGFEGDSLSSDKDIDASELEKIVESHENRVLNLLVWNSKSQQNRGTQCSVAHNI